MIPRDLQNDLRSLAQAPRHGFRRKLRKELSRRASELGMQRAPFFAPLAWATRIGSVAFGIVLVVSGAIAYDNPNVTRESPLYVIKRVGESVELAVARSPEKLVEVRLRLAERRLAEAQSLASRGKVDVPTLNEITSNTQQAVSAAKTVSGAGARKSARAKLVTAADAHVEALTNVSVTAQVTSNKPMVVLTNDLVAIAPPERTTAPAPVELPTLDTAIPLSPPEDGTVAGEPFTVKPSPVSSAPQKTPSMSDPSIDALNDAILASVEIAESIETELPTESGDASDAAPEPAVVPSSAPSTPTETPASVIGGTNNPPSSISSAPVPEPAAPSSAPVPSSAAPAASTTP